MNGRYKDKYFSVLGDSISTLEGYSLPEQAAFYDTARKLESGIYLPCDTWWGMVAERLGGHILVNHSFSGCTVCNRRAYEIESYGCSDTRTSALGADGRTPDVIMILMGTNDWGRGTTVRLTRYVRDDEELNFSGAYRSMLVKLRRNYPDAEIWCLTLPVSRCSRKESFEFPYRPGGRHINEYCEAIRDEAARAGCRVIDINRAAEPYDTIDGFHPNVGGMRTIADAVLGIILAEESE